MKTIDCTPKWIERFPLYAEWINHGTKSQKQIAIDELKKLCLVADEVNKLKKEGKLKI